jgi:hypothetical protein
MQVRSAHGGRCRQIEEEAWWGHARSRRASLDLTLRLQPMNEAAVTAVKHNLLNFVGKRTDGANVQQWLLEIADIGQGDVTGHRRPIGMLV